MRNIYQATFDRYREVSRNLWNFGFGSEDESRRIQVLRPYREATARLFEAIVLSSIGVDARVVNVEQPGVTARFLIAAQSSDCKLLVDKNEPGSKLHVWGHPTLTIGTSTTDYALRFISYFDWDVLAFRDFRYYEVLVERFETRPDIVGRHALVEVADCVIDFAG